MIYNLNSAQKIYILDGTNSPIYQANEEAPIKLSAKNVSEYLDFFFGNVAGRHGRFILAKNISNLVRINKSMKFSAKLLKAFENIDQKSVTKSADDFVVTRLMQFKDALFKVSITIKKDGIVELGEEEPIIEELKNFVLDSWHPSSIKWVKTKKAKKDQADEPSIDETIYWEDLVN